MMNEPHDPGEFRDKYWDESLANVPPTPSDESPSGWLGKVGMLAAAGAGAFLLLAGTTTSTRGATRSAKLQWEERMEQMEQAEHQAEATSQADDQPHAKSQDGQQN